MAAGAPRMNTGENYLVSSHRPLDVTGTLTGENYLVSSHRPLNVTGTIIAPAPAGPSAVALPSAVAFWHSVSFWRPGASPNFALELGRVGVELQASLAVDVSIPPATSEDHRVPRDFR